LLEFTPNSVSAIGTDRYRFSKNTTNDICTDISGQASCFIPTLYLNILTKLANSCKIRIDTHKKTTYISGDNFAMQFKSDTKDFPQYQKAITQTGKIISFKRKELMQDVEALMRINGRETEIHLLPLNKTTTSIKAACDKVESEFELDTVYSNTDISEVRFNPVRLFEMLSQVKSDLVSLRHTDNKSAFFVIECNSEYNRMHGLMPLK